MPATEEYWRDIKKMHVVFATSAFILLAATIWMMSHDQSKQEWRGFQRTFQKEYQAGYLEQREQQVQTASYEEDVAAARKQIAAAEAELATNQDEVRKIESDISTLQGEFALADRTVKFQRAKRDVARANYDIQVRDNAPAAHLESFFKAFEAEEEKTRKLEVDLQQVQAKLEARQNDLAKLTKKRDKAQSELKALNAKVELWHKELVKIDPESTVSRVKREIMEWPIIDGFNSHLKIQQDWIPGLTLNYGGMRDVARFDRCRTCHLGIDRTEEGGIPTFPASQVPQPFSTHPRPDVYLTAASPHPINTFGCTVCHEGQGSGTTFSNASHTPNDPAEQHHWAKDHHYASNHFWEYPMLPERFRESSCLKCHHNVVELGVSPKFGATAPQLYEGYELVREFGCFGCHEISGFDGTRSIGPDMRLEPLTVQEAEKIAADPNAVAGTLRKVGPALTHLASKTFLGWTEHWTRKPSSFRPTTRMPQFFDLEGQEDRHNEQLTPVEVSSIAHYLFKKSQPLDLLQPAEGYQPDPERGRALFSQRGCLACHTHKDFPSSIADFGPELSRVNEKLLQTEDGKFSSWLYTWIREPERHHPRTKMPNVFLEEYKSGDQTIDPAADIVAYLLSRSEGSPPVEEFPEFDWDQTGLLALTDLYLGKVLTKAELDRLKKDGSYSKATKDKIKGDEGEIFSILTGERGQGLYAKGAEDRLAHEEMLLNYVGRRTISRYGCFGCHTIPGFETARPIGTGLRDWGRKDKSKLALEHIAEYLHHHGEPDGSSTAERANVAVRKGAYNEFRDDEVKETELTHAYFYEQIMHGDRAGFLWQKLRAPRSYDYRKIETKNYDERLRMPKFPFSERQIEAVATFILGLVADPPSERYQFQPDGPEQARIEGEKLLTKFNCTGCHMVQLPEIQYAVDPTTLSASDKDPGDFPQALELLMQLKPPRQAETGRVQTKDGTTRPIISFHGLLYAAPAADDPIEDQEFSYDLWETLRVGKGDEAKVLFPASRMLVPAADQVAVIPARGGQFAEWLVDDLMKANPETNRFLAWQMSPPPLYLEGMKVQTPWLYSFLKNPYPLRHTTVLRMPRFNMSDAEAQILANYFSAMDGSEYPYQDIPQREPAYLSMKRQAHPEYLQDSWKMLNAPLCIKCHSVGGREYKAQDPKTDIRGPDLMNTPDRLRPDWLQLWLYNPQWITPYTSMPARQLRADSKQFEEVFEGDGHTQVQSIRDALINYHRLLEAQGVYEWPAAAAPEAEEAAAPKTEAAADAPAPKEN